MLATGEIYHLLNRGVEERVIFKNKRDYERFLITVFESNNINSFPGHRSERWGNNDMISIQKQIKPLVEILCFCLMPTHFHIAAKQLVDGGIAKFMQKVGNGYTKYFNIKNKRKGSLFMSRYKSVHVDKDSQLRHLIAYVHANPLDLTAPEWREGEIRNIKEAKEFLNNYIWSSYPFYANREGLELTRRIVNSEIVEAFYPSKIEHFEYISSWSTRNNPSTFNVDVE